MTEEQKAAELAQAEAQAKAEAEEKAKAERENETDEERETREAEEKSRSQIDFEAELKKEQERRIAAEKAAADVSFKLREKRRKEEEGDEDDEDKPLTRKEAEELLYKDREKNRKEFQSDLISEKARKLAGSEAEANLILEIHKNRSFPEGLSLDEQLEESFAIANRKTIMAQNAELKRALRSKETASNDVAGTHRESAPLSEPKASSHDISAIKAAGFTWDGKANMWRKETHKRIILVSRDLKSQKTIEK